MNKLFGKVIIGISVLLLNSSALFAFYADVPESHQYYDSIMDLYEEGLLEDDSDNILFRPDDSLKLSELYQLLINYGQADLSTHLNLPPSGDISNDDKLAPYVQTALDIGLLSEFKLRHGLDKNTSKIGALRTMFQALGIGNSYFFDKNNFPFIDLKANSDNAALAYKAYQLGIIEKNPEMFRMAKSITRGEAAHYLYLINQYDPNTSLESKPVTLTIKPITNQNKDLQNFERVYETLTEEYYYKSELDKKQLVYDAIEGLLKQVSDKYTTFQEPESANSYIGNLQNEEYEGVGMSLEIIEEDIVIVSPFKNSPAEKAGLKPNDIIIKIDGKDVRGKQLDAVVNLIKGEAGTNVEITVMRDSEQKKYSVKRELISNKSVHYDVLDNYGKEIGYIQVVGFRGNTDQEFEKAAKELLDENIDGLIIDLRNNPGGYMDVAVNMIGLYTKSSQTAVTLKYSNGQKQGIKTEANGMLANTETVVLINEGSASASEIFAGALQDFGKATILGTTSFGKGSVQQLNQFSDGSLFKYTISKWLTPNGRDINGKGLTPDEEVNNSEDYDWQLDTALEEFQK